MLANIHAPYIFLSVMDYSRGGTLASSGDIGRGGSLTWTDFARIYQQLHSFLDKPLWPLEETANFLLALKATQIQSIHNAETLSGTSFPRLGLLECVARVSGLGCSDPRDKLFRLMGLVQIEKRINVDYARNT